MKFNLKDIDKSNRAINIILYLLLLTFGIILFNYPEKIINFTSYVFGVILLIFSSVKIITYGKNKDANVTVNYTDLFYGIFLLIVGLIAIFLPTAITNILKFILGIWILYSGLLKLLSYFQIRILNLKVASTILIISLTSILFGLFILFYPSFIPKTIGILIIIYAVIEIINCIIVIISVPNINTPNIETNLIKSKPQKKKSKNKELIELAKKKK